MRLNETVILASATSSPAVGWVSEPQYRGTLSTLISCLSTLVLCTWSVMHLNVPKKNGTATGYIVRYCTWGLIGIFGPELAIWAAWRQLLSAKALRDEVRHLQSEEKLVGGGDQKRWTLAHGHYAAMGGFVIDLDTEVLSVDRPFTQTCSRLTLTPKGVRLLAECGYLPPITAEEIKDKSKTDELGKILACLQAAWMVVQVCSRLYLKLPVTLLEVTTIGHVLCALVLYMLWWYKPRWIQEPTKIEGSWLRPICAFMFMASEISCIETDRSWLRNKFDIRSSEISNLFFKEEHHETTIPSQQTQHAGSDTETRSLNAITSDNEDQTTLSPCNSALIDRCDIHTQFLQKPEGDIEQAAADHRLDETTSLRRCLAAQAISTYPAIRRLLHPERSTKERQYYDAIKVYPEMPHAFRLYRFQVTTPRVSQISHLECDTEHLVTFVASDWPSDGLLRSMDRSVDRPTSASSSGLVISAFLWLTSIAFAAVHIAAWNEAFPTVFEAWTWRASSAFIGFSGLVWLCVSVLAQCSKPVWWLWYDLLGEDAPKWIKGILLALCGLCGCCYVFSRIFLIVEAFVSLRTLPIASYQVPQWTLSVPHL